MNFIGGSSHETVDVTLQEIKQFFDKISNRYGLLAT